MFRSGGSMVVVAVEQLPERKGMDLLHLVGGGTIQVPSMQVKRVELLDEASEPPAPIEEATLTTLKPCPRALDPRIVRWDPMIVKAASKHELDPNLVRAVIAAESMGNPAAVSRKGAIGLMQLLPRTAADYGCRMPKDPQSNIDAGCQHLARLRKKLGIDRLDLVLAAYNAGEGAVSRAGDIPDYEETQNYVRQILDCLGASPPEGTASAKP